MSTNASEQSQMEKIRKALKKFSSQFPKFYGARAALGLVNLVLKNKLKFSKYSLIEILLTMFNWNNLRTGIFLSLMPLIFSSLNIIFEKYNNTSYDKLLTFISGFIASLIGILISEKVKIMNFIVLYAFVRSIHSTLVIYLNKKGMPTHNKIITWLVFAICLFTVLFMGFYYPSFHKVKNLVNSWARFNKAELFEADFIREKVKNFIL